MKLIYSILLTLLISFSYTMLVPCSYAADEERLALIENDIMTWQTYEAGEMIQKEKDIPDDIMALFRFYTGDYLQARALWSGSRGRYAAFNNILMNLEHILADFEEIDTEYFKIRYAGKDAVIAAYLKENMDLVAGKINSALGYEPEAKTVIEIYPDKESFQTASTLTDKQIKVSGAVGICKFNRIMFVSPRIFRFGYNWMNTVAHEYVHYVVGKITALSYMPLWMNEGLAKSYESIWLDDREHDLPVEINYLAKARTDKAWVPLDKMKHGMPTLDSKEEVTLAFAQVKSMTRFLIDSEGTDKLKKYLRKVKSDPEGFSAVFKESEEDFFKKWEKNINNSELKTVAGATAPSYALNEDKESAINEWISDSAAAYINIAKKFEKRSNYKIAEKKYEQALEKDPGNSYILNKLGKVQMKLEKYKEAEYSFNKAIETNPGYAPPYLHLAERMYHEGDLERSAQLYMDYIRISPFNPASHEALAEIFGKTGLKDKEAIEEKILVILKDAL